jgi:aminoglycoside 2'-N-acetyltransferase I
MPGAADAAHNPAVAVTVRRARTDELAPNEIETLRRMMGAAFAREDGMFADSDWRHATGGTHVLAEQAGEILSHASVVERTLEIGGVPVRTGYVEAVATAPPHQRRGYGTLVMREIDDIIRSGYDLGGLSTGSHGFYERLGWERWLGPTFVRTATGTERTPDDDGGIMILRTPTSPSIDLTANIACEWRDGDVW